MKGDIDMKTNNIFDLMNGDRDNISEQTVIEETGVSTERVREIFMDKVKSGKSTKRHGRKVFVVLAAAAAVLAAGAVTAGATGSFNGTFGQMFAGEPADGMYSGGNVSVSGDEVNVDFKGIAGDKNDVYGLMTISPKDGGGFVDDTDGYYVINELTEDGLSGNVKCTRSLFDQLSAKLFYRPEGGNGSIEYSLQEDGTIEALIGYSDHEYNIIGETLSFSEDYVLLCHTDRVFYTWDEYGKLIQEHEDENDPFWKDGSIIEQLEKKYGNELGDDQSIDFDWYGRIAVITKTRLPLGISGSVKLNYKDTSVKFDEAVGKKTTYSGTENMIVKELEVQPFSVKLDIVYPTDNQDEVWALAEKEDPDAKNTMTVTMKDGNSYTSDNTPLYQSDNMQRLTYTFSDGFKTVLIDPDNIKSIVYNGTVLYEG